MKKIFDILWRFLLLCVLYVVVSAIAGKITGSDRLFKFTPEEQMAAGKAMLIVSAAYIAVLMYVVNRSAWRGVKLILSVFCVYFGVTVFLTQVESFVFLEQLVNILPSGALPVLVLDNTISAAVLSALVVLVCGKLTGDEGAPAPKKLDMPPLEWAIKLAVAGLIYYLVYASFGKYVMVPLAGKEAFSAYYKGLHMPAWMPVFQFFRGIIWALVAVPVIKMFRGRTWETGLAIALLYSVLMGINLIIPLPFMPEKIRFAHFVEVISSNFLFGWVVVYILTFEARRGMPKK